MYIFIIHLFDLIDSFYSAYFISYKYYISIVYIVYYNFYISFLIFVFYRYF